MTAKQTGVEVNRPADVTSRAMQACADWLHYCLTIGWKKDELDALENIWWEHHDRFGKLTQTRKAER